jgi:asparagine synthase (glutamine-hydrolysing)
MCGIAGVMLTTTAAPPDPKVLTALTQALSHRGPDGTAQTQSGNVTLIHTRLAIIDLAGGDHPLFAAHAALIANGEIYNFRELRAALPNTAFATHSDCEPPLHLWLRDGPAYTNSLRGMYAIALHDRAAETLTLSRDPFGIKPLYTAQIPDGLAFASEPQALLATTLIPRRLRPSKRDELLQLQFTTGRETIFDGIDRVLPGETLTCTDGRIAARSRTDPLPPGPPAPHTETAPLTRLHTALMQSVDLHQRSDVPYGMFLSGGIDSAAILALMSRLNQERVLAYTAGFDVPGAADEREAAATTAKAAGARHETIEITEAMVWRDLPKIVAAMDDPAADYAIIPTWFLAQRAAQDVKVVLTGEGGDELLAGYGRYRTALRPAWQFGRKMRSTGTFDGLNILREPSKTWRAGIAAAESSVSTPGRDRLAIAQATDMQDWLPHDLLLKLDRCLMSHSLEGRTPFLDEAVVAATFRLPDALKIANGRGKYLLRAWLAQALPQGRPFAKKQGFSVPIAAWIAAQGDRLAPLVAAQPAIAEIASPDRVRALFRHGDDRRRGFAAWTLLFYVLWHRVHIEARATDGGVLEALATY